MIVKFFCSSLATYLGRHRASQDHLDLLNTFAHIGNKLNSVIVKLAKAQPLVLLNMIHKRTPKLL